MSSPAPSTRPAMGPTRRRHLERTAGNLLRIARAKTGLSQAQLAERAGVPRSTVERIEAGTRQPSLVTLEKLLNPVGLELRIRVDDYDDHDDVLDARYAALSPAERAAHDARHDVLLDMFTNAQPVGPATPASPEQTPDRT